PLHSSSPTYLYSLSLHDALPIFSHIISAEGTKPTSEAPTAQYVVDMTSLPPRLPSLRRSKNAPMTAPAMKPKPFDAASKITTRRSEEHTSELQSRFDLVCRLLLE